MNTGEPRISNPQEHNRPIPMVQENIVIGDDGEVAQIEIVMLPDGHVSKNKIRFGSSRDSEVFVNILYIKKGVISDRLVEGLHITINPIYTKEGLKLSH